MGYRIEYESHGDMRKPLKPPRQRTTVAAIALVLSLVASAMAIKHAGLTWIQEVLLPGDPAVTAMALENMVDNIKSGDSVAEAVAAFCQQIVNNAK